MARTSLDIAREYFDRGWMPIPIPLGEKAPKIKDWGALFITRENLAEYFAGTCNIGGQLGERSGGLTDADHDCKESIALADYFLPPTGAIFGRESKRRSHWLYTIVGAVDDVAAIQFKDPDGGMIVELRIGGGSKAAQTIFPGSQHPSGEMVQWDETGEPAKLEFETIKRAVRRLAVACLFLRAYPVTGSRDLYALCVGGVLARVGLDREEIEHFMRSIASEAGDDEVTMRVRSAGSAVDAQDKGTKVAGFKKLAEFVGEKMAEGIRKLLGHEGDDEGGGADPGDAIILDPSDHMISARKLVENKFTDAGRVLIKSYRDQFWRFDGSCYRTIGDGTLDAAIWQFLDTTKKRTAKGIARFKPDNAKVGNIRSALRSVVILDEHMDAPMWLDTGDHPPPKEFLACANGLLHLPTRELYPATPDLFGISASTVAYDAAAPRPERWLRYLDEAIGDHESIDTLQEWMGYTLTPDTSQQKIFLGVGQSRSGKGTYGRVHRSLLGRDSIAAPTLASLGDQFGKNSLIGKPLAIISDARIGAKTNREGVIETLLSISGEDAVSVQRKFLSDWIGTLSTRFSILTNELPALNDSSGAFSYRLVIVTFPNTFLGREDHTLSATLEGELPGILNWAIDGYARLRERGYFKQPAKSEALRESVETLGSPVKSFVRDRCKVAGEVATDVLYAAWKRWCEEGGGGGMNPGSKEWFLRNLYSAFPGVSQARRGSRDEKRVHVLVGLTLVEDETGLPF